MRALILIPAILLFSSSSDALRAQENSSKQQPKRHVEEIGSGRHAYLVNQNSKLDGANCRSPMGVGMSDGPALEQSWESNRSVRMENVGVTNVINPWLSNGSNKFRTIDEIVASAVRPGMTDRSRRIPLPHPVDQRVFPV